MSLSYDAGDTAWTSSGFDLYVFDSQDPDPCLDRDAWYIGDSQCRYAKNAIQTSTLESGQIQVGDAGAALTFEYFRETRETKQATAKMDQFSVRVSTDQTFTDDDAVFFVDSKQKSWSKWKKSVPISLDEFAGQTVYVQFHFYSMRKNSTTGKGIGISNIRIERRSTELLSETVYDQLHTAGSKAWGAPTTIKKYDEANQLEVFRKEIHYVQDEGRITKEETSLDWDRDGVSHDFTAAYTYDSLGQPLSHTLPYRDIADAITLSYEHRHGALTSLTGDDGTVVTDLLTDSPASPGIEYNAAGGISRIRFGNGTHQHIDTNAAFLPSRIYVDDGSAGTPILDTGTYLYDGARNIRGIGHDIYRYDRVGRLRRAMFEPDNEIGLEAGQYLDYQFDIYGNMTDRQTGASKTTYTSMGPEGLVFTNRSYTESGGVKNRIAEPDFVHDENGNVVTDPLAGVSGYDYAFTPENRMTKVRTRKLASGNAYDGARILQEAEYGPDGNRWLKIVAGSVTGGDAMLTLRDASGQVAVDFMETNDGQGPRASKHYVYGSGRLLAQYSACGPAPQLTVDSMTGTSITFEKLDAAGETWTDHYVVIQDDTGETVKLIGPIENLADTFSVLRSEFSGGGNFVVRVRGESGCGSSGFSNGVTVNLDAAAGSCLDGVALGNWGIDSGTGDATLRMRAHHTCPAGTVFRAVYAQTYMPGFPAQVLEAGLSSPAANIEDTGLTSGLGWDYWFEAHDSGGTPEGDPGMRTTKENWNAYNVAGHAADEASLHVEYLHSDHLGSTRLVTEALGSAVASLKFYPFGHLAEVATPGASDGVRMQFTGHERDAGVGLDYMLARYYGGNFGRFLSVDPVEGGANNPQSWNRYPYVLNNPIKYLDPNGEETTVFEDAAAMVIDAGAAVQTFGDSLNNGSMLGVVADATLGTVGSLVQGAGDMLNIGSSMGETIGAGGSGEDYLRAGAAEAGRAGGIILTVTGAAGGARASSTTLTRTTISTADGAVSVPAGSVRSMAANAQGVVYRPAGSQGNAGAVRAASPNAQNPSGYTRVYNQQGQPVNVQTGKPAPAAQTHPPLTGSTTTQPARVAPVPPPPQEEKK